MESLDRAVSYFLMHEKCALRHRVSARQRRHRTCYAWTNTSRGRRSFTEISQCSSPFGFEDSEKEKTDAGERPSGTCDPHRDAQTEKLPRYRGANGAELSPNSSRGDAVRESRIPAEAEGERGARRAEPAEVRREQDDTTHDGDRNGVSQATSSSSVLSPARSGAGREQGLSDPPTVSSEPCSTPGTPPTGTTLQVFRDRRSASGGDKGRRLTFRMKETPDVTLLLQDPEQALQETRQRCGIDIAPEREASLDGDWDESSMDLPVQQRKLSDEKFREILKHELKVANDETDTLVRDIFACNSPGGSSLGGPTNMSISSEWLTDTQTGVFDTDMLVDWYNHVAESFRQGVRLVKVSMTGKKYLRTVKIDQDFFSVSLPTGGYRHTHLCYMNGAKLGYASGEFMHLLETTDVGAEVPMVQVCGVVRMPSRSVSLIFPSESVRNEFILLVRVKIRMAKYMFGDGSPSVLRANTKGTELRPMETLRRLEDSGFLRNNTEETTRSSPR